MLRRRFNQNDNGEYMTLVASEGNTVFYITAGLVNDVRNLYYSINGGKWTKVKLDTTNAASFNVAYGENIRFKSDTFISDVTAEINFTSNIPFSVTGNILSLGYLDDAKGKTSIGSNSYTGLFAQSQVRHVDANFLPATSLRSMCYHNMFYNCRLLESAPTLPATVLTDGCYEAMFYGCTSLTTAPELPATTLANRCYYEMFNGCSKLNYIKMLATNISASNCLANWVNGVSRTGTFVKNKNATWDKTGVSGVPSGWTVKTE